MATSQSKTNPPSGPHSAAIGCSVAVTILCGILLFAGTLEAVKDSYRFAHQLSPIVTGFWIFKSYDPAPVSMEQVGITKVLLLAIFATFYAFVIHPFVGRLIQATAEVLTKQVVEVYLLDAEMSEWEPNTSILFGAAWPLTMFGIPLLGIALIGGHVYRALWRY